jgi:hypothetical protein
MVATLAEHHVPTAENQLQHFAEVGEEHVAFREPNFVLIERNLSTSIVKS